MGLNDAPSASPMPLKGKLTNRSWAQLPEEIIRLIATHYLLDISVSNHCPSSWENRRLWSNKMVYATIRDAFDIEQHLMGVCPEWHRAIAKHLYWKQAVHVLDYNDSLIQHMVIQPKLSPNASSNAPTRTIVLSSYQHFRNIIACSCYVCRINYPYSTAGLAAAERIMTGSRLNPIVYLCREHDRRRPYFCGLCLRDTVISNTQDLGTREYDISQAMGIMENEDEKLWDGIDSTCKKCRVDWLWKEAGKTPGDRDAIGGVTLQSDDWETRQCVEGFIELAEGSITDVLATAREKVWLKRCTKYDDFGEHALMAQKSNREAEHGEEEEEEEIEEDRDLMLMRDASQVRELALHDWARRRILDGYWMCPADTWYRLQVPGQPLVVPAIHPCPWNRECSGDIADDDQHPIRSIVNSDIPPTFSLCEQAYGAYMKQMREILAHPLRNLVRKIVMECAIPTTKGYEDPALKASRMSIEEVITILREEEGIWYDGVDWIERRRNEEESARRRPTQAEPEVAMRLDDVDVIKHDLGHGLRSKEDDTDSTTSSSSSPGPSSHEGSTKYLDSTSPVLSTSTFQTTPSPPPLTDEPSHHTEKKEVVEEEEMTPQQESHSIPPESDIPTKPRIIPVDPVRFHPQLLSSIPYIPITTAHLPQYSVDAIRNVWRDVCAPLYHCQCSICERAKMVEAASRAAYNAATAPVVPSQPQCVKQQPMQEIVETAEIVLHEVSEIELDGEGEFEEEDLEYDEEEDYEEEAYVVDSEETYRSSLSPGVNSNPVSSSNEIDHSENARTSRKRSSDELDGEDMDDLSASTYDSGDSIGSAHRRRPDGTPPKRARLGDRVTDTTLHASSPASFIGPVLPLSQNTTSATPSVAAIPTSTIKRAKKRSSEELAMDDDDGAGAGTGTGIPAVSSKRAKVDLERPRSLSLAPPSTPGTAAAAATSRVVDRTIGRNSQRTITLDDT